MEYFIICRNKPTRKEINRTLFERTEDPHRESDAPSRYAVYMLATVCDCGAATLYPINPRFAEMVKTLDEIVVGQPTKPFEYPGHIWHSVGPLISAQMFILVTASFEFFLECHSPIDVTHLLQQFEIVEESAVPPCKDKASLH